VNQCVNYQPSGQVQFVEQPCDVKDILQTYTI